MTTLRGLPGPGEAHDPAGLVSLMRQLKEQSGLTYRQLEEAAASQGTFLPRSTLADALSRGALPRRQTLEVFVKACGATDQLAEWLTAWDRIAAAERRSAPPRRQPRPDEPDPVASPPDDATSPASSAFAPCPASPGDVVGRQFCPRGRNIVIVPAVLVLACAVVALVLVFRSDDGSAGDQRTPATGYVNIHPAGIRDYCVTEGRDRQQRYESAIAVQQPCDGIVLPRVSLRDLGEGLYQIRWHHPTEGVGCLAVLENGRASGLLEPRNDCTKATRFQIEPVDEPVFGGYRLHPSDDGQLCLGMVEEGTVKGAEARVSRCTGAVSQEFVIKPAESAA